jgi:hypothetical protein
MSLRVAATEPQARFHALTCKYPAFVAGFGSGKSETMATQAILDAIDGGKDAVIGLYAPTFDLLRLITAPRICEKLTAFGVPYSYNKSENTITPKHPQMGRFILRSLDTPERIVGFETYRAHVDELDTMEQDKAKDVWQKVMARNRQTPKTCAEPFNRVSCYSTPEGFRFVYHRWVLGGGKEYQMVQASSYSNPYLPEDYIPSLREAYPEALINAYIEGQFVNLTSGTVYSSFDRTKHSADETILANDTIYIGMDFNVTNMSAVICVKRNETFFAVDEIEKVYDTPAMIEIIKERYYMKGHRIIVYPDASGTSRKSINASVSDISLLEQAGFTVRVKSKNPAVKDRVIAVNKAFEVGKLKVHRTNCNSLSNCLEKQAYDKNNEPDKKSGYDHLNDAIGYLVYYEMPVRRAVFTADFTF